MSQMVPRLIKILDRWETCQLLPYKDNDGTWHIGFGHGNANNFPPFVNEFTILKSRDEAMSILVGELNEIYVPQLTKLLAKIGFVATDFEFSGLLDTDYNRGFGRLRDSIALKFLQHPEVKDFRNWAAMAFTYSRADEFRFKSPEATAALNAISVPE